MTALPSGHDIKILQDGSSLLPAWIVRLGGAGSGNDIAIKRCDTNGIPVEDSISIDWETGNVVLSDDISQDDVTANTITVNTRLVPDADGGADIGTALLPFGSGWIDVLRVNTTLTMPDETVDSAHIVDGAVDPVHLASGVRTVAPDGALTLAATDRFVLISAVEGGTIAATMTDTHAGHEVTIFMTAGDETHNYTAAVESGTITFNAPDETATVWYDGTNWRLKSLQGATIA